MKSLLFEIGTVGIITVLVVGQGFVAGQGLLFQPVAQPQTTTAKASTIMPHENAQVKCVAINTITLQPFYQDRFEDLFKSRIHAVEHRTGFLGMRVLKDNKEKNIYLIVSFWAQRKDFEAWSHSDEFAASHHRDFADMAKVAESHQKSPLVSQIRSYDVSTD